ESVFFAGTTHLMGFRLRNPGLQIVLDRELAPFVRREVAGAVTSFLEPHGLRRADVTRWVLHPGGRRSIGVRSDGLGRSGRARATESELLDEGVPEREALESLADLRRVNRWLGTHRRLQEAVRPFLVTSPRPRLLDVGCGSADIAEHILQSFPGPLLAVGVDIKLLHLRAAPPSVRRVVADVWALPFPSGAFDVVLASHFLHHFDATQAAAVLRRLYDLARRALIVDDIRRARVPYLFARTT